MSLVEKHYSKFRMLGKGSLPVGEEAFPDSDKDLVDQMWASKVEFIFALKEFYKNDFLPIKENIQAPKIESLVSKKKGEVEMTVKSRIKIKDFIDTVNSGKNLQNFSAEKKVTKLKNFVEKTFLRNSIEKSHKLSRPVFSKATKKLMEVKKLIDCHKKNPLKLKPFTLKADNLTEKLIVSITSKSKSFKKLHTITNGNSKNIDLLNQAIEYNLNPFNKKTVLQSYLRYKYVSDEKLY
jgi:hypothetical protein